MRPVIEDSLVEAGFLFRWRLLLLLRWSALWERQHRERSGMALMTIVAADWAAILFDKTTRELRHHETSDLLSRRFVVEIACVAIGALNTERFRKRSHYLHQSILPHVLQHHEAS